MSEARKQALQDFKNRSFALSKAKKKQDTKVNKFRSMSALRAYEEIQEAKELQDQIGWE